MNRRKYRLGVCKEENKQSLKTHEVGQDYKLYGKRCEIWRYQYEKQDKEYLYLGVPIKVQIHRHPLRLEVK